MRGNSKKKKNLKKRLFGTGLCLVTKYQVFVSALAAAALLVELMLLL